MPHATICRIPNPGPSTYNCPDAGRRRVRVKSPQLILVVEDDEDTRLALTGLLEDEGYRTVGAAHGAEALRHLGTGERPQLILLDLMMPVMDGWEFRVAQKQNDALQSIPVIALSANTSAEARAIDS